MSHRDTLNTSPLYTSTWPKRMCFIEVYTSDRSHPSVLGNQEVVTSSSKEGYGYHFRQPYFKT